MSHENSGYFLYHSIGQYPDKAADLAAAMEEFARVWGTANDEQWDYMLGQRAEFLDLWRKMIGAAGKHRDDLRERHAGPAHAGDRAAGETICEAARCLSPPTGFPSNHFLLTGPSGAVGIHARHRQDAPGSLLGRRRGHDRPVGPQCGARAGDLGEFDLLPQGGHFGTCGTWPRGWEVSSASTITQAAGLLPFSVEAPVVDFAVSTSLKWMCGTPGAGILYVRPGADRQLPPGTARLVQSGTIPSTGTSINFDYAPDIRRFDNGTPGNRLGRRLSACAALAR